MWIWFCWFLSGLKYLMVGMFKYMPWGLMQCGTVIKRETKWSNYITCWGKCNNMFCCLDCINPSEAWDDPSVPLLPQATRLWGYILHPEEREHRYHLTAPALPQQLHPFLPRDTPYISRFNLYKWCYPHILKPRKCPCRNNLDFD